MVVVVVVLEMEVVVGDREAEVVVVRTEVVMLETRVVVVDVIRVVVRVREDEVGVALLEVTELVGSVPEGLPTKIPRPLVPTYTRP